MEGRERSGYGMRLVTKRLWARIRPGKKLFWPSLQFPLLRGGKMQKATNPLARSCIPFVGHGRASGIFWSVAYKLILPVRACITGAPDVPLCRCCTRARPDVPSCRLLLKKHIIPMYLRPGVFFTGRYVIAASCSPVPMFPRLAIAGIQVCVCARAHGA